MKTIARFLLFAVFLALPFAHMKASASTLAFVVDTPLVELGHPGFAPDPGLFPAPADDAPWLGDTPLVGEVPPPLLKHSLRLPTLTRMDFTRWRGHLRRHAGANARRSATSARARDATDVVLDC